MSSFFEIKQIAKQAITRGLFFCFITGFTLSGPIKAINPAAKPILSVLQANLSGPDDLLLGRDGSIYIGDVVDGSIQRITPDGIVFGVLKGLHSPEGMVFLQDGSLVIAEQGLNRLVRFDVKTQTVSALLQLQNANGQLGVDEIAIDQEPGHLATLIIPDSPNGRVLRVSLDGKATKVIASGLGRPVSAWVEPDGSILVTDETRGALWRIHSNGTVDRVARYQVPDDVIEDSTGNIFVTTLGDGSVHEIPANGGQDLVLARSLASPQGLAFDASGNLVVSDQGNHRIIRIQLP